MTGSAAITFFVIFGGIFMALIMIYMELVKIRIKLERK